MLLVELRDVLAASVGDIQALVVADQPRVARDPLPNPGRRVLVYLRRVSGVDGLDVEAVAGARQHCGHGSLVVEGGRRALLGALLVRCGVMPRLHLYLGILHLPIKARITIKFISLLFFGEVEGQAEQSDIPLNGFRIWVEL